MNGNLKIARASTSSGRTDPFAFAPDSTHFSDEGKAGNQREDLLSREDRIVQLANSKLQRNFFAACRKD